MKRGNHVFKLIPLLLLAPALLTLCAFAVALGVTNPALAAETTNGAKIFSAHCASCHIGGGNIIIAHKTLKKPALEKYNFNSTEAVVDVLLNGKNAMPSFRGRLDNQQIEDVAAYVLEKAEIGW